MSETDAHDDRQEVARLTPRSRVRRVDSESQPDQILLMQELERQRIAMDLHDGLGPLITLIKLELQTVKKCMGADLCDAGLARAAIERAEQNVERTFAELRRTVLDLRPAMLDDLGLLNALGWLIRQFELSGTDAVIQGHLGVDERAVPAALKIVIFRICQEALNNVMKHAGASHVNVTLAIGGGNLRLSVEDDGGGIASGTRELFHRSAGGLPGILRRATSSNGECGIVSAPASGTRITVCWPLPPFGMAQPPCAGADNPLASIIAH
jgi:signal transduction histidine kinase